MGYEDDMALIEALHRRGITLGNLLSIAFTVLTFVGWVIVTTHWADNMLNGITQTQAVMAQRMTMDEDEIKKVDAARQAGDAEVTRTLRQLNNRIDNLMDGHHGEIAPTVPMGDITREG